MDMASLAVYEKNVSQADRPLKEKGSKSLNWKTIDYVTV
jgi:hypothetical protein